MELLPCPGCGNPFVTMYVDRMDTSYIKCDCGFEFRSYNRGCSDPTIGNLVEYLAEGWNLRDGVGPEPGVKKRP